MTTPAVSNKDTLNQILDYKDNSNYMNSTTNNVIANFQQSAEVIFLGGKDVNISSISYIGSNSVFSLNKGNIFTLEGFNPPPLVSKDNAGADLPPVAMTHDDPKVTLPSDTPPYTDSTPTADNLAVNKNLLVMGDTHAAPTPPAGDQHSDTSVVAPTPPANDHSSDASTVVADSSSGNTGGSSTPPTNSDTGDSSASGSSLPGGMNKQLDGNNVSMTGGSGNDTLTADPMNDTIVGGGGNNLLILNDNDGGPCTGNLVDGSSDGNDTITVSFHYISDGNGTPFTNTLIGGSGTNEFDITTYVASNGTDLSITIITNFKLGVDVMHLDSGAAHITSRENVDGNAVLTLSDGSQIILDGVDAGALTAADVGGLSLPAAPMDQQVDANFLTLTGDTGNDNLSNSEGNRFNRIDGAAGNDNLTIYGNFNTVIGGDGNDSISVLGTGANTLTGGAGMDTFDIAANSTGNLITDFQTGDNGDVLVLNSGIYSIVNYMTNNNVTSSSINTTDGNVITLSNVDATSLTAHNLSGFDAVPTITTSWIINLSNMSFSSPAGNSNVSISGHNDTFIGGDGNDTLTVRAASDNILTGGAGNDVFSMLISGSNTITDFQLGHDVLSFAKVITSIVNDANHNAVITALNCTVTLIGIDASSLNSNDIGSKSFSS